MNKINVPLGNNQYDIFIDQAIDKYIDQAIDNLGRYDKVFILTQQSILDFYKDYNIFSKYNIVLLQTGESPKTIQSVELIINQLLVNGCTRRSLLIGFGGGVTTDTTGIVASLFMRGIDHVFIPTSLIGMVDASIGGKTGINSSIARNVIGTFKQPKAVFIDILLLKTLPKLEIINGFAEIIKYSLICDQNLFNQLLSSFNELLKMEDMNTLETVIINCCKNKINFILNDEFDYGERMKLNFGHTIGHALESYYKFTGISHGEAVYYGMVAASYISMQKGYLNKSNFNKINNFINAIPKSSLKAINGEKLLEYIKYDKKRIRNKVNFILLKDIGEAMIYNDIKDKDILEAINFISN